MTTRTKLKIVGSLFLLIISISLLAVRTSACDRRLKKGKKHPGSERVQTEPRRPGKGRIWTRKDLRYPWSPPGWRTYRDLENGFELSYPPSSSIFRNPSPDYLVLRISLPIPGDTSLEEKFLRVSVKEGKFSRPCGLWLPEYDSLSKVTINGIEFTRLTVAEGATGDIYEHEAYCTVKDGRGFSLDFVLHSTAPYSDNPPRNFNKNRQTRVFRKIMKSFRFLET